MPNLEHLFTSNRNWAEKIQERHPNFFAELSRQQTPEYLWIGCADSRVPANEIVGLMPGEMFVHRNIANVVVHTDLNCLSVLQFAIELLKVKHVIVVGHYGCSGVNAALNRDRIGLADNWLQHVQDVQQKHARRLECVRGSGSARGDRLCELNVIEQVANVCRTTIVRDAWSRGQSVAIHGWIYGLKNGLLRDLKCTATSPETAEAAHQAALAALEQ